MRIVDRSVYVGPSLYARFPVIRLELDLGALEEWPTGRLGAGFVDALAAALPGLAEHGCSYRQPGGFFRRMREDEGTWLGHVLEHVAIELQNMAGEEVTFGKTRSAGAPGVYTVVYEYAQRDEGIAAGELGLRLLCSLLPAPIRPPESVPDDWSWPDARDEFIRFAQRRALGPSTSSLIKAAERSDIPWLRLNDQSLVQLGHGKFQQRIQATVTSRTSHIAVELASDKEETNKILGTLGLPVPKQELVQSERQAVRAAQRVGFPVVTKPYNGNHGRGISIRLTTDEEVAQGFLVAREHSRSVIVESYLEGDDHRLLVVNGELVAATRRTPGHVVGDGTRTIAQLIDIVNQDPRRGVGHEKVLTRLELDPQAEKMLARVELTAESIPTAGQIVYLRSTANLSTGGTATDVTDIIHPDNREMAERAVRAIGLDVGGVDFLSKDITESYRTIGGGICEVNAAPGFRMHVAPSEGKGRDVAAPVVTMLFPPGAPSRVPIAAITGTNGKTTTARMLAHVTKMAGYTPGLTTTDGVYIDGQRTVQGDMTGPMSARMVLADPQIDIAILETARGGLLRAGMGVREVNVGGVLNVQSDHLGLKGIHTLEQLSELKRIVVEVATDCAVLNADDPLVLKMSGYTEAKNICYVTMNPQHTLVREQMTYSEFVERIPEKTYVCSIRLEPLGAVGLLELELVLAAPIVDLLLGGTGKAEAVRTLTDIEELIMASVMQMIVKELNAAWQPVGLQFAFEKRESGTQIARMMPAGEKTLCVCFEIKMPEAQGVLNLCLPAVVLNTTLRKLIAERDRPRRPSAEVRTRVRELAGEATVGAVLQFPPVRLSAREVAGLAVDMVVRLPMPRHAAAELRVAGLAFGRARPVRLGEHRGARMEPAGLVNEELAAMPAGGTA